MKKTSRLLVFFFARCKAMRKISDPDSSAARTAQFPYAAIAAGMTCLAYSPDGDGAHLRSAGALPFASMFALPDLLRGLLGRRP